MKKEMLINVLQPEECRIAIVEDGVLEELYVERTSQESYTGNIYKGRIVNLEPAIQAAFVDFSVGRNGFLHVSDVEPQYFDRHPGGRDEPEAGPRERDRERRRDPRRERDRDRPRGRGDRRRAPAPPAPPESLEPLEPLEPPVDDFTLPRPDLEDRPRDRERGRDRDRDRNRDRERPDQSIKGRRDRSEPPRRFGEGLVDPADFPPDPLADFDPLTGLAPENESAPPPKLRQAGRVAEEAQPPAPSGRPIHCGPRSQSPLRPQRLPSRSSDRRQSPNSALRRKSERFAASSRSIPTCRRAELSVPDHRHLGHAAASSICPSAVIIVPSRPKSPNLWRVSRAPSDRRCRGSNRRDVRPAAAAAERSRRRDAGAQRAGWTAG